MRYIFNVLFLFIFLLSSPFVYALSGDEESGHEDTKSYLLFEGIYLNSEKKEEWGQHPKYHMNAIFPFLSADQDDEVASQFNDLIQSFIQTERADFKAAIANTNQGALPAHLRKNELAIDYASTFVKSNKDHILSVRFVVQRYVGGMAHPSLRHETFNYDLNQGENLQLSSLFKPDSHYLVVLSGIVSESLAKKLKDNFDQNGVKPVSDHFKNWNIKSEGILFTFDEGQVAPRVFGAQTVLVPYKVMAGLLTRDTIIANCANRQSRCLTSNLLTGGFLDEASATSSVKQRREATLSAV